MVAFTNLTHRRGQNRFVMMLGGHNYPDDPLQNRGSHFNDEAGNHYDY